MTTSRKAILHALRERDALIRTRFGTRRLAIFGSAARDELRENSDVDILVEFDGPATFDAFMDLKTFLEQVLGRAVDLVTVSAIKPRLRRYVEEDLIDVA